MTADRRLLRGQPWTGARDCGLRCGSESCGVPSSLTDKFRDAPQTLAFHDGATSSFFSLSVSLSGAGRAEVDRALVRGT